MITALSSFLAGNVFRMIFGEVVSWLNKKQDHAQEIERMKLGAELDAKRHAQNLEAQRLQGELGIKTIEVQSEAFIEQTEAAGWFEAVKATAIKTGLVWIDAWNAGIRPAVATWAILMMTLNEFGVFVLSENSIAVCSAALGIYLADRSLFKRGK